MPVPAAYKEANTQADATVMLAPPLGAPFWWQAFVDPVLDNLMVQATRNNTNIKTALARFSQALAIGRMSGADRSPKLGLSAGLSRQGGPLVNAAGEDGTLMAVTASLSYDLDILGRLAQAGQAATLDAQSSEALWRNAQLLVQIQVAQTYLALRALDEEAFLMGQSRSASRESFKIVEHRLQSGSITASALDALRIELAAVESESLVRNRTRHELEHALAVLVGVHASAFQLAPARWTQVLPSIPAGVPAAMLARRPDIAAAQKSMLAAQARLGVAQSAWLPNLTLTAAGGFAASGVGDLLTVSAQTWAIGALAGLTVLDGGRREAGVQYADGALEVSQWAYSERIFVAFKEVEDELSALRSLTEQAKTEMGAVESASRMTLMSASRLRNGLASQLELLAAERAELEIRRRLVRVRSAQFQSSVALVRALGGGWN